MPKTSLYFILCVSGKLDCNCRSYCVHCDRFVYDAFSRARKDFLGWLVYSEFIIFFFFKKCRMLACILCFIVAGGCLMFLLL
jgi:hypothetical protein